MFTGFDKALFRNPEFKEDSVREVIIAPMLTRLGYFPAGIDRVIRSKSLAHPFIYVGTRKHPVTIIPDYTLLRNETPLFVLDAKHPSEDILSRDNVQQAYSYAIHPEIKARSFGLCNGRKLAVFSVDNNKPQLVVEFDEYVARWEEIASYMAPRHLANPTLRLFAPDFGVALLGLGLSPGSKITILGVCLHMFMRVSDELMSASSNHIFGDRPHCVSFDFRPNQLGEIIAGLPVELASAFRAALARAPFQAAADLVIEVDLEVALGAEIVMEQETFVPLVIENVLNSKFNPMPFAPEAEDIPVHIFRLRRAFTFNEE